MHRERTERVYGPYKHGTRWRIVLIAADGARRVESFATERDARAFLSEAQRQAEGRTLSQAVDAFLAHLNSRGVRASTERTYRYRLLALLDLARTGAELTWTLTPTRAAEMYAARSAVVEVDTHRGELLAANAFGTWCAKQGWYRSNPFADVEPFGRRSKGRPQLRVAEARRFLDAALAEQSLAGWAAALTLMLGLRASECTDRIVRDVDDGGRLFWISNAKTAAGTRTLEIPPLLVPIMAELAGNGRAPGDPLWGDVDRYWLLYHVIRLCEVAGVPRVTPQGLRGLHATLAIQGGVHVEDVARQMGHASPTITRQHYIAPGVEQNARAREMERILSSAPRHSQGLSQADQTGPTEPASN